MLVVVEEHGNAFDAVNIATAMHRVAKLQPPNADLVIRAQMFQQLVGDCCVISLRCQLYTQNVVCYELCIKINLESPDVPERASDWLPDCALSAVEVRPAEAVPKLCHNVTYR